MKTIFYFLLISASHSLYANCSDQIALLNQMSSEITVIDQNDREDSPYYIEIEFNDITPEAIPQDIRGEIEKKYEGSIQIVYERNDGTHLGAYAFDLFKGVRKGLVRRLNPRNSGRAYQSSSAIFEVVPWSPPYSVGDSPSEFIEGLKAAAPFIKSIKLRPDIVENERIEAQKQKADEAAAGRKGRKEMAAEVAEGKYFPFTIWYSLPSGENKKISFKFPGTWSTLDSNFEDWLIDIQATGGFKYGTQSDGIGEGDYQGYDIGRVNNDDEAKWTLERFRSIFKRKFKKFDFSEN